MQLLIQRVSRASVEVGGETVGQIGPGLAVLCCVDPGDNEATARQMAARTVALRIFPDEQGRMSADIRQHRHQGLQVLVVSQFTLAARLEKGNRPDFTRAAPPDLARALYEVYCDELATLGLDVARGVFGAHMILTVVNDGPVTIPMVSRRGGGAAD